ncbi:MAG: TIR domain-containing protein [Nitrososphaerota archaeon]|nr:TIR domain-containing protein [Nitrososphaerota archaeon]
MGGSSNFSSRSLPTEDSEKLFRSATEEAEQATKPKERVRNVFISFHVEDEPQVNLLRAQSKSENFDLEFRDYSVKEPFDESWKSQCRAKIAQTSATIVMIGPETANRQAVNWEIEESYRQGKKVIGVRIYKDRNDPVPEAMKEHNAPIVDWKIDDIRRSLD